MGLAHEVAVGGWHEPDSHLFGFCFSGVGKQLYLTPSEATSPAGSLALISLPASRGAAQARLVGS